MFYFFIKSKMCYFFPQKKCSLLTVAEVRCTLIDKSLSVSFFPIRRQNDDDGIIRVALWSIHVFV